MSATVDIVTPTGTALATQEIPFRERLANAWLVGKRSPDTRAAYYRDISQWFQWCDHASVDVFRARRCDVDLYDRWMESGAAGLKYADKSRARKLAAISSFYKYGLAEAEDVVTRNPVDAVDRPDTNSPSDTPWLSEDEVQQLFAAADLSGTWDAALVRMLYYCGVRVTELCTATTADLRVEDGTLTVAVVRKGRKRQRLPIPGPAADALRRHLGERTGPLFLQGARPVNRHQVAYAVTRIASAAGLGHVGLTPHGLRHSMATHLFRRGVQPDRVQRVLGHSRIETTMGYAHHAVKASDAPTHMLAAAVEPTAG